MEIVKNLSGVLDVTLHVRQQLGERRKLLFCGHGVGCSDCVAQANGEAPCSGSASDGEVRFQEVAYPVVGDGNVAIDLLVDGAALPEMRVRGTFVNGALVCRGTLHEDTLDELDVQVRVFLIGEDAVISWKSRHDNSL